MLEREGTGPEPDPPPRFLRLAVEEGDRIRIGADPFSDDRDRNHEHALIDAAAIRLAHAIRPFGILQEERLRQAAGADHWSHATFRNALDAAVERGLLQRLPLGFYQG